MTPITYKLALDPTGAIKHVELCQGENIIKISMSVEGTHFNGARWAEVKETMDRLQEDVKAKALESAALYPNAKP